MKKVLVLLANGFEIYEASVFIDVMGWNLIDGDGSTKAVTCGFTKEVKSTFDAKIVADITVDELNIDEYDALALPGGFVEYNFYDEGYSEKYLAIIREFNKKGKWIASICTGGLPVGKSGILEGKRGTTYNKRNGIRQEAMKSFGVNVINEPIVVEGNVITSWNPSTAMDVAFLLLEKLTSPENTAKVKDLMGFEVKEGTLLEV